MPHHLTECQREHLELTLAPRQRFIDFGSQLKRTASRGYDLHFGDLVGDEFQPKSDVLNTLCLINDQETIVPKNGTDSGGSHFTEKFLYVQFVTVHPHHILPVAKHLLKQSRFAHLTSPHYNNRLSFSQQRHNVSFNISCNHNSFFYEGKNKKNHT